MAAAFEDWNSSELADALESNERFCEEVLYNISEERMEECPLWQWDRSDLIDFAYDYIEIDEEE